MSILASMLLCSDSLAIITTSMMLSIILPTKVSTPFRRMLLNHIVFTQRLTDAPKVENALALIDLGQLTTQAVQAHVQRVGGNRFVQAPHCRLSASRRTVVLCLRSRSSMICISARLRVMFAPMQHSRSASDRSAKLP